jgi:hypothetical protein
VIVDQPGDLGREMILLACSVPGGAGGSLARTAAAVLAFPVAGGVWDVDAAEAVAEGACADRAGGAGGGGTGSVPVGDAGRDELGELFADAEFAEAFGSRGRPGWSPGQLALVTVLQFAENLTDRAAAHRVRYGMDLKYALGLELDDPGIDASVLSEFRTRLSSTGWRRRCSTCC